jgi:ABC-type phosphate/phosphonate transport system substrate-binding protein
MTGSTRRTATIEVLILLALLMAACGQPGTGGTAAQPTTAAAGASDLGTDQNPIKMYFVPSAEAAKVLDNGDKVAAALGKATGLKFKTAVPTN